MLFLLITYTWMFRAEELGKLRGDVIAALLVFRLFYLIIPFIMALFVILFFERSQLAQAQKREGLR